MILDHVRPANDTNADGLCQAPRMPDACQAKAGNRRENGGNRLKPTPGIKRWLEFIADDPKHGRVVVQITASDGRASSQLQALRNAGYVEYHDPVEGGPDRIRITTAGSSALTGQASLSYRRDDDRYLVYLGDDRIGFVRFAPDKGRWKAVDATMSYIRWFDTRDAAGKALHRRFTKMTREGRL